MSHPFKVLRGRRIIIEVPVKKESAIKLTEKDEDAIMYEAMKAWLKLRVFAIGDKCEEVKEGEKIKFKLTKYKIKSLLIEHWAESKCEQNKKER